MLIPRPLLALLATSATFTLAAGCLDANHGQFAGEVAKVDPISPVAGCGDVSPPPFDFVSQDVGDFALGRCGHLAWVDHRDIQQVMVHSPGGAPIGRFEEENGWFGQLGFAPGGDRLAFQTFRSDLGFGDFTWVAVGQTAATQGVLGFEGGGTFGYTTGGMWSCDSGGVGGYGDHTLKLIDDEGVHVLTDDIDCNSVKAGGSVVVAAREDGLVSWDLETGASHPIADYFPQWVEGDTYRGRQDFTLSADGTQVAIGNISEALPGVPYGGPPGLQVTVYSPGSDRVPITLAADITAAHTAAGTGWLILGDGDLGTRWVGPDGTALHVADAAPLRVLGDTGQAWVRIATYNGDDPFGVLDLTTGTIAQVTEHAGKYHASSAGNAVATSSVADGALQLAVWRADTGGVRLAAVAEHPDVHWVGEDGTVLASVVDADAELDYGDGCAPPTYPDPTLTLFSPTGAILWTQPARRGVDSVTRAGGVLLVGMPVVNDILFAVDLKSGRADEFLEGHDFRVKTDGSGARVAVKYGPLSAAYDALYFGATPRP